MSWAERANLVVRGGYEALLIGLHNRPAGLPFYSSVGPHRVLESDDCMVFCDAVNIGWALWPDFSTGVLMILEYLEHSTDADVVNITKSAETLETLKSIAANTSWPNNPMCGPIMAAAAKTLLARCDRRCSFAGATANGLARQMEHISANSRQHVASVAEAGRLGSTASEAFKAFVAAGLLAPGGGLPPAQPPRHGASSTEDRRYVCAAPGCISVEGAKKFGACNACKKAHYCSKAW